MTAENDANSITRVIGFRENTKKDSRKNSLLKNQL